MKTNKKFFAIYHMRDGSEQRVYFRFAWQARNSAREHGTADVCHGGDVLREYVDGKVVAVTDRLEGKLDA